MIKRMPLRAMYQLISTALGIVFPSLLVCPKMTTPMMAASSSTPGHLEREHVGLEQRYAQGLRAGVDHWTERRAADIVL